MKNNSISIKHQRRNSELQKVITGVVFNAKNATQFFNIHLTRLTLTKDTKDAKVFFAFLEDDDIKKAPEVIEKLNGIKKEIQLAIPKAMRLKFVPKIIFKLDDDYYKNKRIENIFEEISNEDKPKDKE